MTLVIPPIVTGGGEEEQIDGVSPQPNPSTRSLTNRLKRVDPWTALAVFVLSLVTISAVFAAWIARFSPNAIDATHIFESPTGAHLFGTDELGRDLFARVLHGGQISLGIGILGTLLAMVLGTTWGAAAALGPRVDSIVMRLADALMAVPVLLFALMLVSVVGSSEGALILILGLLSAPLVARVARIGFRSELQLDYCVAARATGTGNLRLLVREVGPNIAPVLITEAVVIAASIIGLEATLSFLGLGIQPPAASWGSLVQGGYANLYTNVTYMLFPSLFIVATIWALNVLADGLQKTLSVGGGERRRFRWTSLVRPAPKTGEAA